MVSHEALIILQQATRKTNPTAYQCIWDNYVIFAQKYHNSTTLSIWVCIYTCVSKIAIVSRMRFSTSFDLTWYAEVAIYTKNLLFFHSIISYFYWITQRRWKCEFDKVWQRWMRWKMPLCKWHTFWMFPWLICCFIVILFYIERKWSDEKFSHSLILEVQIVWKISAFQYY